MFRHFSRTAFRHVRPSSTALTVGVSTTLLCITSLAVAGRNTIRCDSSLEEDLSSKEDQLKKDAQTKFQRPPWKDEEYISADHIFSSGPIWYPGRKSGIMRCDALIVNANHESEDSITVSFPEPSDPVDEHFTFLAIFDGHNGPAMSDFLCDHLVRYVATALSNLPQQFEPSSVLDMDDGRNTSVEIPVDHQDVINDTIKQSFKEVDDAMIDVSDVLSSPSKTNAVRTLRYVDAGSCALMSIYDTDTRLLRVALTGDSRAVLGRKVQSKEGKDQYQVHLLSQDQNANNPAEVARLEAEHPGEEVVKNGRVMGWGMARAFGDAAYKWSLDVQSQLHEKYLGNSIRPNMKTPPYLTAEPEITTTRIRKGDFLIMASDGLWDCLTSSEAVGIVGVWLENHQDAITTEAPTRDYSKTRYKDDKVYERHELPLVNPLDKEGKDDKTPYYPWWRAKKRFVNRDVSAAAHLARNALGGADSDLTEALISLAVPRARKYRDDIAIIVAFFQ